MVDDVPIPAVGAGHAAEDQRNCGIEQLERFGPLPGFEGVGFFGCLFDLPGAPDFVADGPVFDLWGVSIVGGGNGWMRVCSGVGVEEVQDYMRLARVGIRLTL